METEHPSLWVLCEGNLEWGFFTEDPEDYVEKALETASIDAPLGTLEL